MLIIFCINYHGLCNVCLIGEILCRLTATFYYQRSRIVHFIVIPYYYSLLEWYMWLIINSFSNVVPITYKYQTIQNSRILFLSLDEQHTFITFKFTKKIV